MQHPVSREGAGIRREYHAGDAELVRDGESMQAARAAERQQGEIPGVETLLEEAQPDGRCEVRIDYRENALARMLDIEREGAGDPLRDGAPRRLDVERNGTTQKRRGIEAAKHGVGVGPRRLRSALPVACGSRPRAGAPGPDREPATRIDRGDRAAAPPHVLISTTGSR